MPKKIYKGVLNTPIELPAPPNPPSQARQFLDAECMKGHEEKLSDYIKETYSELHAERLQKMLILYEHYNIDPEEQGADRQLAFLLAIDHVPGFQHSFPKKAGRSKKWGNVTLIKLFFEVSELLANKNAGHDVPKFHSSDACRYLIKREPWKSLISAKANTNHTAKVLENKFAEAKKSPLIIGYLAAKETGSPEDKILVHFVEGLAKLPFNKSP